jgi:hypothetical protein
LGALNRQAFSIRIINSSSPITSSRTINPGQPSKCGVWK